LESRVLTASPTRSTDSTVRTLDSTVRSPDSTSALALVDLLGHRREDRVQVTDHAEVDELEDRGLLVLVDGHDGLRGLHAGAVLDRAGDAVGDVQLRRHRLAGLTDLEGVRDPAGVDGGTRGTDRRAE